MLLEQFKVIASLILVVGRCASQYWSPISWNWLQHNWGSWLATLLQNGKYAIVIVSLHGARYNLSYSRDICHRTLVLLDTKQVFDTSVTSHKLYDTMLECTRTKIFQWSITRSTPIPVRGRLPTPYQLMSMLLQYLAFRYLFSRQTIPVDGVGYVTITAFML